MRKMFLIAIALGLSSICFAQSETMKIVEVVKGDAFLAVNYKGQSKILHLAAVSCPNITTADGVAAKNETEKRFLNKQAYVTVVHTEGNHAVVTVSPALGKSGQDLGAELLQKGLCWYNESEVNYLRSVQKSSYKLLADRARSKKLGIWKSGEAYFVETNPSARVELDRMKQTHINGVANPVNESVGRPTLPPKK